MHGFTCVFFEVGAGDSNTLCRPVIQLDFYRSPLHNWKLVLTDLISLGKIRIEVVFACEHRAGRDFGIRRKAEHDRHAQHLSVEYRQHPRESQIDGACLPIRLGADSGWRARKNLAPCRELRVNFKSHYGFPCHRPEPSYVEAWAATSLAESRGASQVPVGGDLIMVCDGEQQVFSKVVSH